MNDQTKFSDPNFVQLGDGTTAAIRTVSARTYVKPSECCRRAILAQLERDGLCPLPVNSPKAA